MLFRETVYSTPEGVDGLGWERMHPHPILVKAIAHTASEQWTPDPPGEVTEEHCSG